MKRLSKYSLDLDILKRKIADMANEELEGSNVYSNYAYLFKNIGEKEVSDMFIKIASDELEHAETLKSFLKYLEQI